MRYTCPVCGYDELANAPELFSICPCCATEFGNTDFDVKHEELRSRWLARGAPWFDQGTLKPANWSPERQLTRAGLMKRPLAKA